MAIRKIDNFKLPSDAFVRVKEMGNIIQLMYMEKSNSECVIRKLDKDHYCDLRTGEVKEYVHNENRASDLNSVRCSLNRLSDYINTNVSDPLHCKWVTLTYAENMTDTNKLYTDFEKFIKRSRYKLGKFEYIVAMEPQGRGAWHAHLLMIFPSKAPYIDNNKLLQPIWGHGYTKTKKLDNIDNIGAYLTAYLGDMELSEAISNDTLASNMEITEKDVDGIKKKYVKGARMSLYPSGFNLYRVSRGIVKPKVDYMYEENAQKKVSSAKLTFEKTIGIETDDFTNTINYRQYNKLLF